MNPYTLYGTGMQVASFFTAFFLNLGKKGARHYFADICIANSALTILAIYLII
jgi:hypothetical protein